MNAPENITTTTINAAHGVLQKAKDALCVAEVARAMGASKPTASKQLKELYGLGLIESEPRTGGTPFYRLIAEPAPAALQVPTVCDSVQTEGSAQTEALEPERVLTPEAQAERAQFVAKYDHDGNCSCHISPPCGSCMHPGNPRNQDEDESCWMAEPADDDSQYLVPEDYVIPPADPELLAMANRMLGDRLEGVAHVLRGCGLPGLADASGAEDLQPKVAALSGAYQIALGDLQARTDSLSSACSVLGNASARLGLDEYALPGQLLDAIDTLRADLNAARGALTNAINEADRLRNELATERQAREALQEQDGVEVTDVAVGYLVRATKRKPRYVTKPERARDAALAAVRAGAGRAEVLAVVPVGVARRGAEWRGIDPTAKGD